MRLSEKDNTAKNITIRENRIQQRTLPLEKTEFRV